MTEAPEFEPWPKIARLNRDVVVTEKIDGTNACVVIAEDGQAFAQSRTRNITPEQDNYGFAKWVADNAATLVPDLGPGRHFGEWWGQGIQRRYGQDRKRFSLFNVHRWEAVAFNTPNLDTVPVLARGPWDVVEVALSRLRVEGSAAAPGFLSPEGVVIYHTASRQMFKVTLEKDDAPKGLAA